MNQEKRRQRAKEKARLNRIQRNKPKQNPSRPAGLFTKQKVVRRAMKTFSIAALLMILLGSIAVICTLLRLAF